LTNGCFTILAKVFQLFFLVSLLGAQHRSLKDVLVIFVLKLFHRENAVIFVAANNVVSTYALLAPESTTLKTIGTLGAFLVAIAASHLAAVTFFNSQNVDHTVQVKTCRKILQIAALRYFAEC